MPTRQSDSWGLLWSFFLITPLQYLLVAMHWYGLFTILIPVYAFLFLALRVAIAIVVQGSDVLQYTFGKLFGRRKIAPHVSPSKTLEGFVGGIAAAAILGAQS
ncbi:MAG: phosphatidate cytidylyltransferase, partial [Chloroflexi bacterium]